MPSLNFKGKALVQNFHLVVPYHELKPVKAKSLTTTPSLHDNLVVHGDNLKALKSLLPYYGGKVKCVYIDPPYNTGTESWVYNDNVNSPMMSDWLGKVVDREDLTRHDKWLCMMMPRLRLLREFLRDDGIIFVSIDDNEFHHLRVLMDEIFGPENFYATIAWQKKDTPSNDASGVSVTHEYVLAYVRTDSFTRGLIKRTAEQEAIYKNPDNDPRGVWTRGALTRKEVVEKDVYPIANPKGREVLPPPGTSWRVSRKTLERLIAENRLWWGKDQDGDMPFVKRFLSEVQAGVVPVTWWEYEFAGSNRNAKMEIRGIFGNEVPFDTAKPTSLISRLLEIVADKDGIVLDCFAGSGTTGQAVLTANKLDSGSRRFVLIENEAFADTVTAERTRLVIRGVKDAKDDALRDGLGGTFTFVEVGNPMQMESLLKGSALPSFEDLAGYVFYTATGEDFDARAINKKTGFIGTSVRYDVYLFYEPDLDYLKKTALTLDIARALPKGSGRRRLVFAPTKYLDAIHLEEHRIDFCQLPFEIYKAMKPKKA